MIRIFLGLILAVEIFALGNRGGGPLLSYLFLTGITFLVVCIAFLFRDKLQLQFRFVHLAYTLFFLFFLLSLVISLTPGYDLAELLLFANFGILLFIFSGLKISERDLHWFSLSLIALATIDTLIGYFIYTQTPFARFAGTFIDLNEPYTSFGNDFANFLLLILPVAIWQFFRKHKRVTTVLVLGIATAVLFSGFILSFSRGAWVSFDIVFITGLVWLFLHRRKTKFSIPSKNFGLRITGVIFLTIFLVNGLQWTRSQKFQTVPLFKKVAFQSDEGTASASERIQFWKGAAKLIGEQPLFGTGVLSFKYLYPKYQPTFGANWDHPHNLFLKFGVENGIFAMFFFALFLVSVAAMMLRFLRKRFWHPCIWFLFGALGAFGHNLIDVNFIVANFTLFIIFIALGLGLSAQRAGGEIQNSNLSLRPIFIISFFLLLFAIHEAFYNIDFKRGRAALATGKINEAATLFERTKNLFFERDLGHYLALVYQKKYEETKDPIWRAKEVDLLNEAAKTTIDASIPSRLGLTLLEEKSWTASESMFEKALVLDPQNRLRYYYDLVYIQRLRGKPISPALREKILVLLDQYKTALRENRHITILTDNPNFASKLYEFLELKKEQEKFNAIWFQELLKFSTTFGKIQKPILQS